MTQRFAELRQLDAVELEALLRTGRPTDPKALGELLKHRLNRASDAVEAFDHAQKLEPTNRRRAEQLAEIYAAEPKRWFSKAVSVHQQLLAMSPYRIESYQALRKLYTEGKKPDESWCLCQALTVLKNAEPDEEAAMRSLERRLLGAGPVIATG